MKLLLLHILVFYTEVTNLVPDADQVAPALKVSHFDCSSMTENSVFAINQVRPCHITSEELEVSKATIALYTKHFRKELNATKCRIRHQREKWHCEHLHHSSIDHTVAGITSHFVISPETAEPLQKELVSTCKATGLELNGLPKFLLLKFLVIQEAQTGTVAKQKAGFLGIPLLSTCKKQLWKSRSKTEKCYPIWDWFYLVL